MRKNELGPRKESSKDNNKPSRFKSEPDRGKFSSKPSENSRDFKSGGGSAQFKPSSKSHDSYSKPNFKNSDNRPPFRGPSNDAKGENTFRVREDNRRNQGSRPATDGQRENTGFSKKPFEKKPWDSDKRPFEKNDGRLENKAYEGQKPWQKNDRQARGNETSFRKEFSEKRGIGEKRVRNHEKPERDHPRPEFKPYNDQTPPRFSNERPSKFGDRKEKGFGENRSEAFHKGKFNADDRKPPFEKSRTFEKSKLDERQVGSKRMPNFDEDRLKKQLPPKVLKKVESGKSKYETIRLNRYIANAGLCSRREADELISSGQITVNGKVIVEMGYQVQGADVVKYGRKILNREKLVYVLLNKPKDFLTTTEDPVGRKTVMDLVSKACEERIYPVGRLDRATTGLLLLTNDGELADKLSHPSNNIKKIYQAEIDKPISQEDFDKILEGVELEDGLVKADDLSLVTPDAEVIGIEIHSGKNRIVRRIFEHLGYEVTKLDRTTYAGLTKKDLPRGNWRFLTEKEVIRLKYLI
jgi:23S rRNA pseudouridine2605 synthase